MSDNSETPAHLLDYRKALVAAEQKAQEDFDKTVLSLSGGALGISFVFLKDVVGVNPIAHPSFLFLAWVSWAFSTFFVLASYHLSHLALRRAISQVDDGTIYDQRPGGVFANWTAFLNGSGAVLFLTGVCFITLFAYSNLSNKGDINVRKEATVTTSPTTPKAASETSTSANTGQPNPNKRGLLTPDTATPTTAPATSGK